MKEYLKRDVVKQDDQTWCKISNKGNLEYLDWLFIEQQAERFDAVGESGVRDQTMTICKLMVLVRKQTIEKTAQLVSRFADYNNNSSAVVIYDPTEIPTPPPVTFVFFHVGDDLTHPLNLVDSIKKTNPESRIIMTTDSETPHIEGIGRFEIQGDRERLIPYRLKAFATLALDEPAIYLDTDMVVLGKVDLALLLGNKRYAFCNRSFDRMAGFNGKQEGLDFSENDGRPMGFVYPILACFSVFRHGSDWAKLYDLCQSLPDKYLQWYGDQEALREFVNNLRADEFNLVEESQYACSPEHSGRNSPLIIHHKGNRKNEN